MTDLTELKIEADAAISKGLRIGHYAIEAATEIARLRAELGKSQRALGQVVHDEHQFEVAKVELAGLRAENEALRNTLTAIACIGEKMREALRECADELAERVEHDYVQTKHHPGMARRYERDMAPVVQARAAIAAAEREGET